MAEVANETLVDERYRILERIGSGGMADVYLADDTHLGRQVALKVLHRRFAADDEFVERFRREASSAAGLQHPHVVGVYDRGEHEGTYYIAMENLRGRTLKRLIQEEAPLEQERAIDLGIQMLQAAGFAHRHGVVHRDFKPHNVIVDKLDRAKVTDFGIARAGASEMTETGSIMGTAQYLSPEQAQGQHVTGSSDLYSIGVILYEMLAAQVPFKGDSAVSIALKHVNAEPPPLSELRPDLHPLLERTVMRALAKEPEARYTDADEFIAALDAARTAIQSGDNGQDTAMWGAVAEEDALEEERRRRWPWILLGLLAVALVAAGLLFLGGGNPKRLDVPSVKGLQIGEARAKLEKAGFNVEERRVSDRARAGTVLAQNPRAGQEADEGSTVVLRVSGGPGEAPVPLVAGLTKAEAVKRLNDAGFQTVQIDEEVNSEVDRGRVIRTDPAGGLRADRAKPIKLLVSAGPRQVRVPGVVGQTRTSAEAALERAGLGARVVEESSGKPEGEVIGQEPGEGAQLDEGSTVLLTVSKGQEAKSVPSVIGLREAQAVARLRGAGFDVRVRRRLGDSDADVGKVIDQDPGGGAELEPGRTVTITVGREKRKSPEQPDDEPAPDPGAGQEPTGAPGGDGAGGT
jgi:serine/threonine-protein kinase